MLAGKKIVSWKKVTFEKKLIEIFNIIIAISFLNITLFLFLRSIMQYKSYEIQNRNLYFLKCDGHENINANDENYSEESFIIEVFQNLETSNEKLEYFALSKYFPEIIDESIRSFIIQEASKILIKNPRLSGISIRF